MDKFKDNEMDAILRQQLSPRSSSPSIHQADPNEVSAYLDGALSPARLTSFENHLIGCTQCRQTVINLRRANLDKSPSEATSSVEQPLAPLSFVEKLRQRFSPSSQFYGGWGFAWRGATSIALLLLIVAFPVFLYMSSKPRYSAERNEKLVAANKSAESDARPPVGLADSFVNQPEPPQSVARQRSAPRTSIGPADDEVSTSHAAPSDNVAMTSAPADRALDRIETKKQLQQPALDEPKPRQDVATDTNGSITTDGRMQQTQQPQQSPQITNGNLSIARRDAQPAPPPPPSPAPVIKWTVQVNEVADTENAINNKLGSFGLRAEESKAASADSSAADKKENHQAENARQAKPSGTPGAAVGGVAAAPPAAQPRNEERSAWAKKSVSDPMAEYRKRIGEILLERFNKALAQTATTGEAITVRLKIDSEGKIVSLENGRIAQGDVIHASTNSDVTTAALKAITDGALPAPPAGKGPAPITLTVKFAPQSPAGQSKP